MHQIHFAQHRIVRPAWIRRRDISFVCGECVLFILDCHPSSNITHFGERTQGFQLASTRAFYPARKMLQRYALKGSIRGPFMCEKRCVSWCLLMSFGSFCHVAMWWSDNAPITGQFPQATQAGHRRPWLAEALSTDSPRQCQYVSINWIGQDWLKMVDPYCLSPLDACRQEEKTIEQSFYQSTDTDDTNWIIWSSWQLKLQGQNRALTPPGRGPAKRQRHSPPARIYLLLSWSLSELRNAERVRCCCLMTNWWPLSSFVHVLSIFKCWEVSYVLGFITSGLSQVVVNNPLV